MTPKTAQPVTYRVTVHLIQVQGEIPGEKTPNRHYWRGDVLPHVIPAPEIERLLSMGAIEAAE